MPRDEREVEVEAVDASPRKKSRPKRSSQPSEPTIDDVLGALESMAGSLSILSGDDDNGGTADAIAEELGRIGDALEELVDLIKSAPAQGPSAAGSLLSAGAEVVSEVMRRRQKRGG